MVSKEGNIEYFEYVQRYLAPQAIGYEPKLAEA